MTIGKRDPAIWKEVTLDTRTLGSPSEVMNSEELECLKLAGRDAGAYLMEIGKTDMAKLEPEEWLKFSSMLVLGYELNMASRKAGVC
jgi:hypothetical protein